MSDCDGGETHSTTPSVSGPECCTPQVTQAHLNDAVQSETSPSTTPIVHPSFHATDIAAHVAVIVSHTPPDRQALHPPIFLLNSTLLI